MVSGKEAQSAIHRNNEKNMERIEIGDSDR
jgi:hypothetical protein